MRKILIILFLCFWTVFVQSQIKYSVLSNDSIRIITGLEINKPTLHSRGMVIYWATDSHKLYLWSGQASSIGVGTSLNWDSIINKPTLLKGDKGDQGERGIQGTPGANGYTPVKGIDYFDGSQGIQGIQGLPGATGNQGIQGLKGDKGDRGDQGIQGLTGNTGIQGLQGIQGIQGIQGTTDYNALLNKPIIPAAQVQSDWNSSSGMEQILNKPTIPTNTNQLTNGNNFITLGSLSGTAPISYSNTTGAISFVNPGYITSYTETDPIVKAISGIVKSNGTTISAAVSGTDYVIPSGTINIGTTAVTINRASGALTLAGITLTTPNIGAATGTSVVLTGAITSSGAGIGYVTGAGGTVTQSSSRTTGVTLNKLCGTITMFSSAVAAQGVSTFTLTNSFITATDYIDIEHISTTNGGAWQFSVVAASGSVAITVRNVSTSSITEATPFRFVIIKASTN